MQCKEQLFKILKLLCKNRNSLQKDFMASTIINTCTNGNNII